MHPRALSHRISTLTISARVWQRTFEDAWTVIGHYEKRPLIEEYHKAMKTGWLEERQYRTADRLEAAWLGFSRSWAYVSFNSR